MGSTHELWASVDEVITKKTFSHVEKGYARHTSGFTLQFLSLKSSIPDKASKFGDTSPGNMGAP